MDRIEEIDKIEMIEGREVPSVLEANLLYLFLGLFLWFVGSGIQSRKLYAGLLLTEYAMLLLPNLMYLEFKEYSFKRVLKLNKISIKQIIYIILITICAYPIAVFSNFIMTAILTSLGSTLPEAIPMAETPRMYFVSLFVIGLAPAICEEVMFRGTIMTAYESLGKKKAIIYSSILFSMFHLNLQNLLGPLVLGVVLGIIVYKTNSLFAGMLAHGLSNSIAVTIGYIGTKALSMTGMEEAAATEIPKDMELILILFILGVFALISYFILVKLIKLLPEGKRDEKDKPVMEEPRLINFSPLAVVLILFIIINVKVFFIN